MKLESKYNLGDVVWTITDPPAPRVWVRCTFCLGYEDPQSSFEARTVIVGDDGRKVDCPICKGNGGEHILAGRICWEVAESLTIGLVQVKVTGSSIEETYMCKETGIGSGRVYYHTSLYSSNESAQCICDMKNSILEENNVKA